MQLAEKIGINIHGNLIFCFVITNFSYFIGSLLLESKINPNTAYQKQQVKKEKLSCCVLCVIFSIW